MKVLAWENSRHLATLPLVSSPNDVWETSTEIPYWWRVITQVKGLGLREFTWQKWIIGYNFGTDDGAESKFGASKELMVLNILNYECCVNKSRDM